MERNDDYYKKRMLEATQGRKELTTLVNELFTTPKIEKMVNHFQTLRGPEPTTKTNFHENIVELKIYPKKGPWLVFRKNEKKDLTVQIDVFKDISFKVFARLFNGPTEEDWLHFAKYYAPQRSYDVKEAKHVFQKIFLNEKHYEMSVPVRTKLNKLIKSNCTSMLLTKEDIEAIGDYLILTSENENENDN